MPDSRKELMQIYRLERPKFLMPKQHKKFYTREMTRYSLRRHYT